MIQIYLSKIHCDEETNELSSSDEPYVLVTAVDLAATLTIAGVRVPFAAFDVVRYGPFNNVDAGETHLAPGVAHSFWGIAGDGPAPLDNPDQVIFVVALMEHDAGRPGTLQGIVKGIVGGSVLGSLTFPRGRKVATLLRDVNSALGTPSAPSLDQDNPIGDPQELRFTRQELVAAAAGQPVSRALVFEGDGGRYTLTFEAGMRVRVNAKPGATVTVLLAFQSRLDPFGHVDVFATSRDDGTVWSTFETGRSWQNWFPIHPDGPGAQMKPGATVTVLQPFAGHVDLFATRNDGTVMSTFFEVDGGWREWFEIRPETRMGSGATVSALQPFPGHVDLFVIGDNHTVMSTFFEVDGGWREWFEIQPRTKMTLGATVTVLQPFPGHVDLFATRDDGTVVSTFFEVDGGWREWFEIHSVRIALGATVSVLQPFEGHVDLFATRADGTVMSTFFEADGGWRDWFEIHPETKMAPGATVTVLQPFAGHVDLFATRADGTVMSTFFEVSGGWREWFEIGPETKMQSGAPVTALLRFEGHVDLFAIRADGTVVSTFFEVRGGWREWFAFP